jgi:hypothetical protein
MMIYWHHRHNKVLVDAVHPKMAPIATVMDQRKRKLVIGPIN